MPRRRHRPDPNDPAPRSSLVRSSSLVATTEIGTPVFTPAAASCPTPAKQPGATNRNKRPQPTRMKNDPKSFFSVRITSAAHPRPFTPAAADGCSRVLGCIESCKEPRPASARMFSQCSHAAGQRTRRYRNSRVTATAARPDHRVTRRVGLAPQEMEE